MGFYRFITCFFLLIFFSQTLHAANDTHKWLKHSTDFFIEKSIENISPKDGKAGAILAAKSMVPNYHYHWVRDAGLVADALVGVYSLADSKKQLQIKKILLDYRNFSAEIQNLPKVNLGEPKFHVDGSPFTGTWSRPQNDGPALRAISLIHFANLLLKEGEKKLVNEKFYNNKLPAETPIKKDLEYISHHWQDPSYDLWEEVNGTHFYTLMVQRRALIEGGLLAKNLGDNGASTWYLAQSRLIEAKLENFYNEKLGYFVPTLNYVDGVNYKHSELDTAVLLGLLHGGLNDGFLSWDDPRIIATMDKLEKKFAEIYPINHNHNVPGIAIGRYPEDRYSGTEFNEGNPWVLCTLAFAEGLYNFRDALNHNGNSVKAKAVEAKAKEFIERVRFHAHKDGTLDEQINRYTGYMTSANDLTWNYAALITTRLAAVR